ncbi:MAG: pitrilysin family protein [Pyrinomonadaceae bacterium]
MKSQRRVEAALLMSALFLLLSAPMFGVFAQQLPSGVEKVTAVEGITEYRMPNGLRVLLFPDQTKQTITVNVTYLVGSRHENYGETGMAHLLEHMLFKGSPKHTNIPQELTSHGARPNGSTWFDRTNYFETFASTDENLNWALDLEADRMVNSYVAKKDLDSEFSVVRNEFESGENNPTGVLEEKVLAASYQWHNYGNTTIGARSDIENVPIERLQAFYRTYYQPDNAVLLVAGKFDDAKTLGLISKYFSAVPKPTRTLPKFYTIEPTQDGERQVTVRRTGDTQVVMTGYHIPPGSHPDFAALDVAFQILGDTPSGRLYKALVESKKASSVYGTNYQLKEPGIGGFVAEVRKEDSLDAARDAMLVTVENFTATPPTKEEVERAKTQMLKFIDLTLNASDRVGLALSEYISQGDWRLFFLGRDRLRKVTPEDVARVAQNYFKQSNRTLGYFVPTDKPDRAEVPFVKEDELAAMFKDYKGDAALAVGEAFDPSPTNIEARLKRLDIGNLKVAFLPKKNRGETVFANIKLDFGDEKSLTNRVRAASFVGAMLRRGTTKHTRQQLNDEFDRLKAQVSVSSDANSARVSIETTKQNFPEVLRLVGEMLREPAFPASEFETLRKEQLTGIESQKSEPTFIAVNEVLQIFNIYPKGHPLHSPTLEEQIADVNGVTLDEVKTFYKDFYGASNGQMTVIGDFDEPAITAVTKQVFGNWKSPRPFTRLKNEYRDITAVNKSLETPDKANAFFIARLNLKVRDDNPDYPALILGNYMMGGGFLNSRLLSRWRQKDGVSYGGGSQLQANAIDESGAFLAFAIYAPQNVGKVETGFKEEIARVLADGFTADEIATAKSGWLQSRQVSRAQDRELAGTLNNYLYLNRTLAWDIELEKKVAALTPEQINTAMRKYVTPDKITIIKAGDFAKATAKP